jgi:rod shape-determining protein MreC
MLMLGVMALVIIFADMRFNGLASSRALLSAVTTPVYWLTDLPRSIAEWGKGSLSSRERLIEDNLHLSSEALLLKAKIQQIASLRSENMRLRRLLNSTALLKEDVLIAELIGVSPDPSRHVVILNKGSAEGVYMGQPLIDSGGLMGQVVEVSSNTSRVLLITDTIHALPVQVNRNGVRSIAEGIGSLHQMQLRHVPATTDIRKGDLLVTSGLGQRFPVGYPVAVVRDVLQDPGHEFSTVIVNPSAAMDRSRHVLLVFTEQAISVEG